jgi:hypothetical protein
MGGAKIWFLKKTELDLFQTMALKNKFLEMPFSINNMDVDDISYILAESFGINIRAGLHCAPLIHHYINSDGSKVHDFTCKQVKGIECGDDYGEFIVEKKA